MKIINAPYEYDKKDNEICCFLAGGCSNIEWQTKVVNELNKHDLNSLVIYNPYNSNIESNYEQIQWEFYYLNNYINDKFIFSVYFDKYTDQPISMYELGRASVLCKPTTVSISCTDDPYRSDRYSYYVNQGFPIVVSCHPECKKLEDIKIQCGLAHIDFGIRTPEEHAKEVLDWYKDFKEQ